MEACHPCAEYEHFLRISNWADNFRLHKITLSLKMNFLNKQGNLRHLILNTNSNLKTPRSCHRGILNNLRMFKYFPLKFALSRPHRGDIMTEIKVVSLDQSELSSYFRWHLIDQSEDSILLWQLDISHLLLYTWLSLVMSRSVTDSLHNDQMAPHDYSSTLSTSDHSLELWDSILEIYIEEVQATDQRMHLSEEGQR